MDFSDDISPIFDPRPKIPKELAFSILKTSLSSLLFAFEQFFSKKLGLYWDQWKINTIESSKSEQILIQSHISLVELKVNQIKGFFEHILKTAKQKIFLRILFAAKISDALTHYKTEENFINIKTLEFEKLSQQEQKKNLYLEELTQKFNKLKVNEEENQKILNLLKKNNEDSRIYQENLIKENRILKEIESVKNENSELQDKLVNYEINVNNFIHEIEILQRRAETPKFSPAKARLF